MEQSSQTALPYSGGNKNAISRHFEENSDGSYCLQNFVYKGQSIQFKVNIIFEKCFFEASHMPDCTYRISSHINDSYSENEIDRQKAANFLAVRHPVQTVKQTQDEDAFSNGNGGDPAANKPDIKTPLILNSATSEQKTRLIADNAGLTNVNTPAATVITDIEKQTRTDIKLTEIDTKPTETNVKPTKPDDTLLEQTAAVVDTLADPDTSVDTNDPLDGYTTALVSDGLRVNWLNMMCNLSPLIAKSVPVTPEPLNQNPPQSPITFNEPSESNRSTDITLDEYAEFSDKESTQPDNIDAFVDKMAHFEDLPRSSPPTKNSPIERKRKYDVSINMNALLSPLTPLIPTFEQTSLTSDDNKDVVKTTKTEMRQQPESPSASNKPGLTPIIVDHVPDNSTVENANNKQTQALRRSSGQVVIKASKDKQPIKRRKSSIRKFIEKVQDKQHAYKQRSNEIGETNNSSTKAIIEEGSRQKDSRQSTKARYNTKPSNSSKSTVADSDEEFDKSAAEAIYSPKPLRYANRPKRQSLGNLTYSPSLTSLNETDDKDGITKFVPIAPPRRRRHTEIGIDRSLEKRTINNLGLTQNEAVDGPVADRPSSVESSRRLIGQSDLPTRPVSAQMTRRRGVCMPYETGFDVLTKAPSEQTLSTRNTVYRTYSEQGGKVKPHHATFSRSFAYNYRTPSEIDLVRDDIMEHETTISRSTRNINASTDDLTHLLSNYKGSLNDLSLLIRSQNFEDNPDLFSQSSSSINTSRSSLCSPVFAGFPSHQFGERVLTSMNQSSSLSRRRVTTSAHDLRYTHKMLDNHSDRSGLMEYETTLDQYNSGTARMRKTPQTRATSMVNISTSSRTMQYETTLDRSTSNVGTTIPKSSGSRVNLIERGTSFDGKLYNTYRTKSMTDLKLNENNFNRMGAESTEWIQLQRMEYETTLDGDATQKRRASKSTYELRSAKSYQDFDISPEDSMPMQYAETTFDKFNFNTRGISQRDSSTDNLSGKHWPTTFEGKQQRVEAMERETILDVSENRKRVSTSAYDLRSSTNTHSFQEFDVPLDSVRYERSGTLEVQRERTANENTDGRLRRPRRHRTTSMVNFNHSKQYEAAPDKRRSLVNLVEKNINLEDSIEPIEGLELFDRMQYESKI